MVFSQARMQESNCDYNSNARLQRHCHGGLFPSASPNDRVMRKKKEVLFWTLT